MSDSAGSQAEFDKDQANKATANSAADDSNNEGAYVPPVVNPTGTIVPGDISQADEAAKKAIADAAAATSEADAAVFEQARNLSTTNANTSTESLLGNYIDPNLVKITATMGENPSITYVETNGKAFDVNIQVDNKNASNELAKLINPDAVEPVKKGFMGKLKGMLGRGTAKGGSSGRRGGHTKKNRKHRITKSNRKKVRLSRRR